MIPETSTTPASTSGHTPSPSSAASKATRPAVKSPAWFRGNLAAHAMMVVPFAAMHLIAIFGAWHVGFRWEWLAVAIGFFYLRMFGITAGYHRYFSHRSFETSRWFAFVLAFLGSSAAQKGVIWWAGHHRDHHKYSDQTEDIHSPVQKGFWQSHVGWILGAEYDGVKWHNMKDFAQYPEIRFIQNYWLITPVSWGVLFFYIGGWPLLVWGLFVSTVALYHATFTINSLSHVFGKRRYKTTDTSRNNWMLALLTMGEGWHNNHHYYQASVRQGFYWWEIDMSYMILKVLSWFGIVWNLKVPPERVLNQNRYTADELAAWRQDSVLTAPAIPAPVEAN